ALTDVWPSSQIEVLAELLRKHRPRVLPADPDFIKTPTVHAMGTAFGIPTVYETRGFWEESWLTRAISTQGWNKNAENIFATYGHPSAYALRKHAEEVARSLTNHNLTLAEVMKEHILESGEESLQTDQVTIVPN